MTLMHSPAFFLALCLVATSTTAQCNTPPTAVPDSASTLDNQALWIAPLANDSDLDGQPLSVSILSEDCPGTVTTDSTGLLIYVPTTIQSLEQICSITYSVSDGSGGSDSAIVSLTVTAVPPEIFADGFESGSTAAWSGTA